MKLPYNNRRSQNLFHCCITEWVTKDPKRDKTTLQAASSTPYFSPWITGHGCNANKQKASLCFTVLLMSPLVSNHLIPQMLKNTKVKISFVLPSKCIAKGVTMSLLHFLVLWVVFCNAFSHTRTKNCCARKEPLVQHACPLEGYPFITSVSLLCTSIPCFPCRKICLKLVFMPFALMVLFSKLFHMLPITF